MTDPYQTGPSDRARFRVPLIDRVAWWLTATHWRWHMARNVGWAGSLTGAATLGAAGAGWPLTAWVFATTIWFFGWPGPSLAELARRHERATLMITGPGLPPVMLHTDDIERAARARALTRLTFSAHRARPLQVTIWAAVSDSVALRHPATAPEAASGHTAPDPAEISVAVPCPGSGQFVSQRRAGGHGAVACHHCGATVGLELAGDGGAGAVLATHPLPTG